MLRDADDGRIRGGEPGAERDGGFGGGDVEHPVAFAGVLGMHSIQDRPVAVEAVRVSGDGLRVSLDLAELVPGYVYEMNLNGLVDAEGTPMVNTRIYYTLNQLKQAGGTYSSAERSHGPAEPTTTSHRSAP